MPVATLAPKSGPSTWPLAVLPGCIGSAWTVTETNRIVDLPELATRRRRHQPLPMQAEGREVARFASTSPSASRSPACRSAGCIGGRFEREARAGIQNPGVTGGGLPAAELRGQSNLVQNVPRCRLHGTFGAGRGQEAFDVAQPVADLNQYPEQLVLPSTRLHRTSIRNCVERLYNGNRVHHWPWGFNVGDYRCQGFDSSMSGAATGTPGT